MKAYRRRFVVFTMLLIGIVLTAVVAGVAVYMYRDYYDGLHDTMAQVVKPLRVLSADADAASGDETAQADTPAAETEQESSAGDTGQADAAPAPAGETDRIPEGMPADDMPLQPPAGEQPPVSSGGELQPPEGVAVRLSGGEDARPAVTGTAQPPAEGAAQPPDGAPPSAAQEMPQPLPAADAPQPSDGSVPQPPEEDVGSEAPSNVPEEEPVQQTGSRTQREQKDITAVVYDPEDGSTSVLSASAELDADTLETVLSAVSAQEADFGTLPAYDLIYYRDSSGGTSTIALADTAYISSSMADLGLVLAAVWLCAMLGFLAVSLWLSGLAVRPMEESVRREKQFVADVSHDLKTPLAVITANNSILLENPEAPVGTLRRWVDSTGQAARQMQSLVDEMLTLTAAQQGIEAPLTAVDLSGVVTKAALQLESVAYDRQVSLETEIAAGITVQGSLASLQRIASGLMENAIKYEPSGGSVTVSLSAARRQVRLGVRNHGSVIAPEALPHVFDRFYRGDKSRGTVEGHGLGLAIVRQLTENLGGSITVRSGGEEGTVFLVTLPLRE